MDNQPFSVVEDKGFVRLMSHMEPRYKMPSRKYITETVISKVYEEVKQIVVGKNANATYVSLTTDIWSTDLNSSFFAEPDSSLADTGIGEEDCHAACPVI